MQNKGLQIIKELAYLLSKNDIADILLEDNGKYLVHVDEEKKKKIQMYLQNTEKPVNNQQKVVVQNTPVKNQESSKELKDGDDILSKMHNFGVKGFDQVASLISQVGKKPENKNSTNKPKVTSENSQVIVSKQEEIKNPTINPPLSVDNQE